MARRLSAFAAILALSLLAASPSRAGSSFDLGLVRPGMPLAELRQAKWPPGSRLLCSGDPDLPPKVDSPQHDGIVLPPRLVGRGLIACGLFAQGADGTWVPGPVEFAGAPAKLWALAIVQTGGAGPAVVQVKLWQQSAAFPATRAALTDRLGAPVSSTEEGARWSDEPNEVILGHSSSEGILTIVTDRGLEAQVRDRMDKAGPHQPPTNPHPAKP